MCPECCVLFECACKFSCRRSVFAEALSSLPYAASGVTPAEALKQINEFRAKLAAARQHELSLKPGLDIFEIPPPDYSELSETEKEVEALAQVWEIANSWEAMWNQWKTGEFAALNVESMEAQAANFNKQVRPLMK